MRPPVLAVLSVILLTSLLTAAEGNELPPEALAVLKKAASLEVYSLEPTETTKGPTLQGWRVLGKTAVKGPTAAKAVEAVRKAIEAGNKGAKCFDPRHALRANHGGKTVDVVICFECHWAYVYVDGKKVGRSLMITSSAAEPLDAILRAAKIAQDKPKR